MEKQLDGLLVNETKTQYSISNLLTMEKTNQKIKVLFNLAIKNQQQNDYESAATNYEKILKIEPNHFGTNFSFGSLLIEAKKFEKAKKLLENSIRINPNFAKAQHNLGLIFYHLEKFKNAIKCYEKAIKIEPGYNNAHQALGAILKKQKDYKNAIDHFKKVNSKNSRSQILECLYLSNDFNAYKKMLEELTEHDPLNIRVATFSTYVSAKKKIKNIYPFCKNPLKFFFNTNLINEIHDSNIFLDRILKSLEKKKSVWEPFSKTTVKGSHTSNNIFNTEDPNIFKLKKLIEQKINFFQKNYKFSDDYFIKKWPLKTSLHAWHVKLVNQGHQKSHIHDSGWLSGVFYLKLPKVLSKDEGSIKLMLYGYDFPEDDNLPYLMYSPKAFDLILFPSSLFHKTIPFNSEDERHSIAFDLKPKF